MNKFNNHPGVLASVERLERHTDTAKIWSEHEFRARSKLAELRALREISLADERKLIEGHSEHLVRAFLYDDGSEQSRRPDPRIKSLRKLIEDIDTVEPLLEQRTRRAMDNFQASVREAEAERESLRTLLNRLEAEATQRFVSS